MFCSIMSAAICGVDAVVVQVEADVSDGMPQFVTVGSAGSQVKEGQDRVRTALRNVGIVMPPKRITINLVPADIRKEGTRFDLPVAAAVLQAVGRIPPGSLEKTLVIGEVRLNGGIQGVTGVLPTVLAAREAGCRRCVVPKDNIIEGKIVDGIEVVGVGSLEELIRSCCEGEWERVQSPKPSHTEGRESAGLSGVYDVDFGEIAGQEYVKRAALIAVCGFHNLLLSGPPGSGKTMIARRIPTVMPGLTAEEELELSKIYSVAGMLPPGEAVIRRRPFREPHHTITPQALAGGGRIPVPGEITLAHLGVLFLDELAETPRRTIEILRQPLEEHRIVISRTGGRFVFPADFMLVAAMNPCPCGFYPDLERCTCTSQEIARYLNRISQPLLDRMDLCVEVPAISYEALIGARCCGTDSEKMREEAVFALNIQRERYGKSGRVKFNSGLSPREIEKYCTVSPEGQRLLKAAFQAQGISARGYHRILKVARTIADMEGSDTIRETHISEAICYRGMDKNIWRKI